MTWRTLRGNGGTKDCTGAVVRAGAVCGDKDWLELLSAQSDSSSSDGQMSVRTSTKVSLEARTIPDE